MRSIQKELPNLTARGVKVVAVSVDPPDATKELATDQGYTFPMLSDTKREVIRHYDLLHEGASRRDIARPAEFLIDEEGIVRWRNLTEDYKVRMKGKQVLDELERLGR